MAPEQLRCELVDARVDLYATGVVMYQMLTGKLPYEGETLSALTSSVLYGSAAALTTLRPDCPPRLAALIERALARAPEERFQSASEMLEALSSCRDPLRRSVASDPPLVRVLRRMKRPRDLAIAVTLLAVAALVPEQVSFASALRSAFPRAFPHGVAAAPVSPNALAASAAAADSAPALAPSTASVATSSAPSVAPLPAASLHAARTASVASDRASNALAARVDGKPQASASTLRDRDKARALTRRGLTLYLHGELDAAYAVYRQATLLANTEAPAFRGLGLCASRMGRKAEARRAFARYLDLASDAADAHLIRARLSALNSER
jgi:tetratricopeptide (TPR) repeat protein